MTSQRYFSWIMEAWNPQRKTWEQVPGTNAYEHEEAEALGAAQIRNWERLGIKLETRVRKVTYE